MLKESRDFDLLVKATESVRSLSPIEDLETWFECPDNIMVADGDSVGLATLEYPGLYNVHWFYAVKGRNALNLGHEMMKFIFEDKGAQAIRGWIRTDLRPSLWAARQIGLKSLGVIEDHKGRYELFFMTKEDYKDKMNG